jgi:isopentenyl-diphosphate delta-isomerase
VGNIGISQIIHAKTDAILRLSDAMGSRALAVHLNALQECLQPEGTPQFRGALSALERLCKNSGKPIVVKETGCGFSQSTLKKLANVGVAAIDLSGRGGTHWGRIEGRRAGSGTLQSEAAETFASWGESTVDSLMNASVASQASKASSGPFAIWASGGLRSGLDAAKAIALGAERVGFAKPALEAALAGPKDGEALLRKWMTQMEFELKLALFCTGSSRPEDLRRKPESWSWTTQK